MNSRHWFSDGQLRFDATVSNDHCFTTVLNKPDLMYSADVKEPSHSSLFIPDFDPELRDFDPPRGGFQLYSAVPQPLAGLRTHIEKTTRAAPEHHRTLPVLELERLGLLFF
jgi:hypothetical protein